MQKSINKKLVFIISIIAYAIYTFFLYGEGLDLIELILFLFVIFSGLYLAEDLEKYKSTEDSRRLKLLTIVIALILAVVGVILHYPINEAKGIILEALIRGIIAGLVFVAIEKFRKR